MTNELTDNLFSLIHSLSPSEKRQFSLYVGRVGVNSDSKFLSLFKVMTRQRKYDEKHILQNTDITKQQLSNVKAHLYRQILISLRLNPSHQNVSVQIREQLDFAIILYRKGLYNQSLKLLDRIKQTALFYEEKNMVTEILDWEKIIESQYITRSIENRAEQLIQESDQLSRLNSISGQLSNLSLRLYSVFLKTGHAKTKAEAAQVKEVFQKGLPEYRFSELGFREKLWLYKASLWHSFISQDFLSCFRYSKKWIGLFEKNPHLISLHPVSYLKGNHYLLESLFLLGHVRLFEKVLDDLEKSLKDSRIPDDDNIAALAFLYLYSNKLNLRFMKADFENGQPLVDKIQNKVKKFSDRLDEHHIMIFYYKIGCLYFGAGDNKKCIEFLQKIINNKSLEAREDLMCFSRILNLVAHYEAGMDYHLESLIRSTYKFLIKMNDLHEVQKEMIRFLRNLPNISPLEIKGEFRKLHQDLKRYEEHPFERRAFLYLDILSWLESKIEDKPVGEIMKRKLAPISVR